MSPEGHIRSTQRAYSPVAVQLGGVWAGAGVACRLRDGR